jgi:D-amino peptidase
VKKKRSGIMGVVVGLAVAALAFVPAAAGDAAQAPKKLKVFISVDMEGVAGVIHWEDVSRDGKDYGLFRRLMTLETNAAVEGALAAGATEIVVRDAHGSARNILPDLLHPEAQLIRDWSGGPLSMMEGIDASFDAVVFVGYHARAGTSDAVLKHTMSGTLYDVILNGTRMPEAGINAAIAGHFGVPVVLVAGDGAICRQAREILGESRPRPSRRASARPPGCCTRRRPRKLIRERTEAALKGLGKHKPYRPKAPYTLEIVFTDENLAAKAAWVPGARRTAERAVAFTSSDLMEIIKFFRLARL